jgi:hypothetical protein
LSIKVYVFTVKFRPNLFTYDDSFYFFNILRPREYYIKEVDGRK